MLRNAQVAAGGLLVFVAALSGACRTNDVAIPTVVTIAADPALAESALDVATDSLRPAGLAVEAIEDAYVAYALGNFVFDQDWSLETEQGVVLEAAFDGKNLKGIQYGPIRIVDQHQPVFAEPAEARQIVGRIWEASAALP